MRNLIRPLEYAIIWARQGLKDRLVCLLHICTFEKHAILAGNVQTKKNQEEDGEYEVYRQMTSLWLMAKYKPTDGFP